MPVALGHGLRGVAVEVDALGELGRHGAMVDRRAHDYADQPAQGRAQASSRSPPPGAEGLAGGEGERQGRAGQEGRDGFGTRRPAAVRARATSLIWVMAQARPAGGRM